MRRQSSPPVKMTLQPVQLSRRDRGSSHPLKALLSSDETETMNSIIRANRSSCPVGTDSPRSPDRRDPPGHGHDVNSPIIICAGMNICLSQSKTIIRQVRSRSRRDRIAKIIAPVRSRSRRDRIAKVIAPVRFLSHRDKIQVPDSNLRLDAYLFHIVFTLQIICDFLNHLGSSPVPVPSGQRPERPEDNKKDQKMTERAWAKAGFLSRLRPMLLL